jgi:hypothetical protein
MEGRIKGIAHDLCQMFCGWRLTDSLPPLTKMGSGRLEIDVLTEGCKFQGNPIPPLPIARELKAAFPNNLKSHKATSEEITRARLLVSLSFSLINSGERMNAKEIFYQDNIEMHAARMHRCKFDCVAEIEINGTVYRLEHDVTREWPEGWPDPSAANPKAVGPGSDFSNYSQPR